MDHQGIEETDLIEAYVSGRLGEQDRAAFEAHLVDCPECLDQVEAAQRLASGLRALGAQAPAPLTAPPVRRWRAATAAWAIAASVAAVLAVGWATWERRRLESALDAERVARSAAEARAQDLAQRTERVERAAPPPLVAARPPGPVPVLTLVATRSADLPTLTMSPSALPAVLLVERESPPRFGRYRVSLDRADGNEVLSQELAPSSRDVLAVGLDPSLLQPGVYVLTVVGLTDRGGAAPVGRHRFRVVPAP